MTNIKSGDMEQKVIELRNEGLTIRQIQEQLGISSPSVVHYYLKKKKLKTNKLMRFVLPERIPPVGDKKSELMCAGFNEYRNLVIEIIESL